MLLFRQLTSKDLPLVDALLTTFGEAFDDVESYSTRRPSAEYLRRSLAGETLIVVAALIDSTVVGGLVAYEFMKFEQERSEIYLYDLAVAAEHRRQGIATSLIEKLKAIAAERGVSAIFVQADTDPDDEPAAALYTKLGTRKEVLHFDIPVDRA